MMEFMVVDLAGKWVQPIRDPFVQCRAQVSFGVKRSPFPCDNIISTMDAESSEVSPSETNLDQAGPSETKNGTK
jgi:hypothetical protein